MIFPKSPFNRKQIPKELLLDLYCTKRLNVIKIGKKLGVSHATVARWLHRYSIPLNQRLRREDAPNWKGGQITTKEGRVYIYLPEHPKATMASGYVPRAILVWEKQHGHKLPKNQLVHHRNEKPWDDRPSNLQAMTKGVHRRLHQTGKKYSEEVKRHVSEAKKKWWDSEEGKAEKERRRCA